MLMLHAALLGLSRLTCRVSHPSAQNLTLSRAASLVSDLPKPLGAVPILPARQQTRAARVQVHLQVVGPVPDTVVSI